MPTVKTYRAFDATVHRRTFSVFTTFFENGKFFFFINFSRRKSFRLGTVKKKMLRFLALSVPLRERLSAKFAFGVTIFSIFHSIRDNFTFAKSILFKNARPSLIGNSGYASDLNTRGGGVTPIKNQY